MVLLCANHCHAQKKISITKWVAKTVDSLQRNHVDTIEYYHSYCGECMIADNPNEEKHRTYCETDDGWTQIESTIIYQQKGKYYSLTFNCNEPAMKKTMATVASLQYFLSIIPDLDKRDKTIKAIYKRHQFLPMVATDGSYEDAYIFCRKVKQGASMRYTQKTDAAWRAYFWIDKETDLFRLMLSDIKSGVGY